MTATLSLWEHYFVKQNKTNQLAEQNLVDVLQEGIDSACGRVGKTQQRGWCK